MRRQSWVKEGRWPKQCVALRVHKKAEISQKPVSIEDDGVKNEHVFQSIPEVLSKGAVVPGQPAFLRFSRPPTGTNEMSLLVKSSHLEHRVPFQRVSV